MKCVAAIEGVLPHLLHCDAAPLYRFTRYFVLLLLLLLQYILYCGMRVLQIDLRFSSKDQGSLEVVVAPVLRFTDLGFGANVRIEVGGWGGGEGGMEVGGVEVRVGWRWVG